MPRHPSLTGLVRSRWTTLVGAVFATAVILGSSTVVVAAARPEAAPHMTVTAPTGTGTYDVWSSLTVSWTTTRVTSGEFGVWVQSPARVEYVPRIVPVNGGASYSTALTLVMPAGSGYRAVVAWRPTIGTGDWTEPTTSPGSFTVTAPDPVGPPDITVTAPTGTATYAMGSMLTVSWTTTRGISAGEFGVWVVPGSLGTQYLETIVLPDGGTSYSAALTLAVPAGTGYRALVAWHSTTGKGAWPVGDWSPGSFTVTGTPNPATAITAFSFQGLSPAVVGAIDDGHHMIGLPVPAGTDVTALVATFTTTGASVAVGGTTQASGTTPNDFTHPVAYTVTATDGSRQDWVVTVWSDGPVIGQAYGGGIVAYIFQAGDPGYVPGETHGLISATADQGSKRVLWALPRYQTTEVPGGTGTALGDGSANTDRIIAQNGAGTGYAAGLARAYRGGGYTDWYLPSKDELHKLCLNQAAIGGFAKFSWTDWGEYWSSSEYGGYPSKYVWDEAFSRHLQGHNAKGGSVGGLLGGTRPPGHVRAVRRF